MPKIRALIAIPAALLAFASAAQALELVYDKAPAPTSQLSDAKRESDIRLGDCLKANHGKMTPRCEALRDSNSGAAAVSTSAAPPAPAEGTVVPVVVSGTVVQQ
jgi:hypothetical protein